MFNMDDVLCCEEFLCCFIDIKLGLLLFNILLGEFCYVLCDCVGNVIIVFFGVFNMLCGKV